MIHFGVILEGRRDIKMYIYARINKNTLKYIREKKAVSFDYIEKITKFSQEKISAKYCEMLPYSICRALYECRRYQYKTFA